MGCSGRSHNNIFQRKWDYLVVTASNEAQAAAYETQLGIRRDLGLITGIKRILVVPDPQGRRIGSGGSTIYALLKVLSMETKSSGRSEYSNDWIEEILQKLHILIIHAGGDSRRLPAYGPCGKIFTPIPGKADSVCGHTIFDRQFPIYRELPAVDSGNGQVVVTTGDVLLFFHPEDVRFRRKGVTGLGCYVAPEQAKNHGVYHTARNGEVRRFLQKPPVSRQKERGIIHPHGQSLLDIGVMNLDAATAIKLISLCGFNNGFHWNGPAAEEIRSAGLDFYREICCAMGKDVPFREYLENVHDSGSRLSETFLRTIYDTMSKVPFFVQPLEECTFLHFGTPRQLVETGSELMHRDHKSGSGKVVLSIANLLEKKGRIAGSKSWVEGCRIRSELTLEGENVVVGVDVERPLSLPPKSCLDIIQGYDRKGEKAWFVRVYGIDDAFKDPIHERSTIGNRPFSKWKTSMGVSDKDIWEPDLLDEEKNLWNAKIFPAVSSPDSFCDWLWILNPEKAETDLTRRWHEADRYSLEEISGLVSLDGFHSRRQKIRAEEIRRSMEEIFDIESGFSALDLAFLFEGLDNKERIDWIRAVIEEGKRRIGDTGVSSELDRLGFSRIIHTLASAIKHDLSGGKKEWSTILQNVYESMAVPGKKVRDAACLDSRSFQDAETWCNRARDCAFENLSRTIVWSRKKTSEYPRCAVRADEIIWGRAPARLDLGGGWTDTPPYALEHGGCVINAAVDLNGQPPIHVYARIVKEPVIRITSIDHGIRITIKDLNDLLDYRKATSKFALAKAALALSGFSPDRAIWPKEAKTLEEKLKCFGGGIELTTLAAIPSGSGLGTSSIMGAVLVSVINRMIGKETPKRELFNLVLQLEQELTTGGGWQDQIGGSIGGVKMITTEAGLIPDPRIRPVRSDVLDPAVNKGQTLLYYTGMRRLAKNILRNIVGHYLDRNRPTMETLRRLHVFPPFLVEAMEGKDMRRFGELIDMALLLKKKIDPESSNPEIEKICEKFKPYMRGATFLGAGGGGFLLVVGKSREDAVSARKALEKDPPNELARFFDYTINTTGLEVTVC